jgi:hypothetical protein
MVNKGLSRKQGRLFWCLGISKESYRSIRLAFVPLKLAKGQCVNGKKPPIAIRSIPKKEAAPRIRTAPFRLPLSEPRKREENKQVKL